MLTCLMIQLKQKKS